MSNKKIKAVKDLSKDELVSRIRESEANLFRSRMQNRTGQLENTGTLWQVRKDIARMKMLLGAKTAAAGK